MLHLLRRVVEEHWRPGPAAVALQLEIVERAGIAGRHLRPCLHHHIERSLIVRSHRAGRVIDDYARASFADSRLHLFRKRDVPAWQMALALSLLSEMNVHDGGAGIVGALRLGRHLGRRYRHRMLLGIGEHAIERACDHYLGHGTTSAQIPICAAARFFITSSVPPPIVSTLTSR